MQGQFVLPLVPGGKVGSALIDCGAASSGAVSVPSCSVPSSASAGVCSSAFSSLLDVPGGCSVLSCSPASATEWYCFPWSPWAEELVAAASSWPPASSDSAFCSTTVWSLSTSIAELESTEEASAATVSPNLDVSIGT